MSKLVQFDKFDPITDSRLTLNDIRGSCCLDGRCDHLKHKDLNSKDKK